MVTDKPALVFQRQFSAKKFATQKNCDKFHLKANKNESKIKNEVDEEQVANFFLGQMMFLLWWLGVSLTRPEMIAFKAQATDAQNNKVN